MPLITMFAEMATVSQPLRTCQRRLRVYDRRDIAFVEWLTDVGLCQIDSLLVVCWVLRRSFLKKKQRFSLELDVCLASLQCSFLSVTLSVTIWCINIFDEYVI